MSPATIIKVKCARRVPISPFSLDFLLDHPYLFQNSQMFVGEIANGRAHILNKLRLPIMKKLFITLATLAMTFSAFAQGTVNFATRSVGAKVFLSDGITGAGLGAKSITAQLAIVTQDA